MYFISNIFLRIRGGSKSSCTNAIFFVQELIDHPSYIKKQLLEHDAYISCLQLKKVNVAIIFIITPHIITCYNRL